MNNELSSCPHCGMSLPVLVDKVDEREALFCMGYKTVDEILRELAACYPAESLIATLRNLELEREDEKQVE